jgi:hypothetical protein
MRCPECKASLETKDTRKLKSDEGVGYVRRVRVCNCGYRAVTHEVPVEFSKIPDTKRSKRNRVEYKRKYRLQCKAKKEKEPKISWLDRIKEKLETA